MKSIINFDLTEFNSYKIKANCKEAYFPENEEDVIALFSSLKEYILIGSGHNIILSQKNYAIPFIIFNGNYNKIERIANTNTIVIEAGAFMANASKFAMEQGLSGIEMFHDIPSSLGGAVVMNAGASGKEIKDVLVKVRYLDLVSMKVMEKNKDELNFEYRNSDFQSNQNKVVLKAWLKLIPKAKDEIWTEMEAIRKRRWAKQPKDYPNAGSVFKRPEGRFVGPMLDELNLKGYGVGGAMVSCKHSGFIVNKNNASGKDILELIKDIQNKVKSAFDVDLEVEQRII